MAFFFSLNCIHGIGIRPGERLRQLADRFAETEERRLVKVLAEDVRRTILL